MGGIIKSIWGSERREGDEDRYYGIKCIDHLNYGATTKEKNVAGDELSY